MFILNGIFTKFLNLTFPQDLKLKRAREAILDQKIKEFRKDKDTPTGGPLRVYANSVNSKQPYKTLLVSNASTCELLTENIEDVKFSCIWLLIRY